METGDRAPPDNLLSAQTLRTGQSHISISFRLPLTGRTTQLSEGRGKQEGR